MASKSELGNAINIANLMTLNTYSAALGERYNPTNPILKLENLTTLYGDSYKAQETVNINLAPYSNSVDDREAIFSPLNKNLTKLKKAFKATAGVDKAEIEDLDTVVRVLKGERKSGDNKDKTPEELANQHSVSQLSYIKRTDNMDGLISLLSNTPNYNPNEVEFKTETYRATKQAMLASTAAVNNTFTALNTARSIRDKILYQQTDNLVDTANKAKDYLLSILDSKSPEYKAIFRLKFVTPSKYK